MTPHCRIGRDAAVDCCLSFIRSTCRSLRGRLALALLVALPASAMAQTQQPGNAAGFEIDGNLRCTDVDSWVPAVATGEDWHFNPPNACTGVFSDACVVNPARTPALFYRDPHWAKGAVDPDHFNGASNKNNDNIASGVDPWTVTAGNGPQKNDITEFFVHSRTDINGDLWIILAVATRAVNGDSHIDFEFNRAGLTLTPGSPGLITGNGPDNGRTIGDINISIDYENGGTDPIPTVHEWDGTTFVIKPLLAGQFFSATNQTFTAAAPCGTVDPGGSPATTYVPLQFAEVAINASLIGIPPQNLCGVNATLMAKSRSSQEFTAELKDLAIVPFSIVEPPTCSITGPAEVCQGATAQLCGPAGNYSYAWTGPNGFGANTQCINASDAGEYTLVITDLQTTCQSASCSHTLTVNPPPVCNISGPSPVCPGSTNNYCGPAGMASYGWSISGNGSISGAANGQCVMVQAGNACNTSYTLTLDVTDNKGCSSSCSQSFLVNDTQPPVVVSCPAGATIECPAVPAFGDPSFTDNCDTSLMVTFVDSNTPGSCPQEFMATRTWTATDDCGNSVMCSQTITVEDNTAPVIACPADLQLQCGDSTDPANTGNATATDACGAVTITFADVPTQNCTPFPGLDRTWTATDACGNTATCVQHITYVDSTPPVILCPPNVVLQCGESSDPSNTGTPTVSDNCGGTILVDSTDEIVATGPDANCAGQPITRTWTAMDACGNVASCVQLITFADTTPPVIQCPPGRDLQCGDSTDPANTGQATATDNCGAVTVSFTDTPTQNCTPFPGVDRLWRAVDACGNTTTCVQTITIVDTTPPMITCPADVVLECGASTDPANTGTPTVSDNCLGTILVDSTDEIVATGPDAGCAGTSITRTWKATDSCGNMATCVQIISFQDTTPPTVTCPPDRELQCGGDPGPANTGSATGADGCSAVTITFADTPIPANCTGQPGIDRMWTATDACGNTTTCLQHIVFVDTTPPTIVCPPDAVVECGSPSDPDATGRPTASDNCGGTILVDSTDEIVATSPDAECAGTTITRTWTATDPCGNVASCIQIISFQDTTPPTIQCAGDVTVGACNNVVTFQATASDICDPVPTIVCVPPSGTAFPLGTTTVTCTATDDCGNQAQCAFTVTVLPNPVCEITGPEAVCEGQTAELCGPAGSVSYLWSGPGGFSATTQCVTVGAAGTYDLTVTDPATGCTATCSHPLAVNAPPTCSITGPTTTCVGVTIELCGPDGNLGYAWTGPGGFAAETQCISVSGAGDYQLVVTDLATKCVSLPCTHHLDATPCQVNCPRTAGFWAAQCDQTDTGKTKFSAAQMTQISECVDARAGIFNWPSGQDFSRFCSTVSTGGTTDQRRQAKRQFVAFLANLCTDELNLIASNGDEILLDPTTPIACAGLNATTIGALTAEVDALLLQLEGQSLADPMVKSTYSQIIGCLDAINNGENIGAICPDGAAQNQFYRDYDPASLMPTSDVVELYRPSPNPFAHSTRIAYVISGSGERIEIGIFDLAGRKIRILANGFQGPGRYEVVWDGLGDDGARANNGVYFVRSLMAGAQKVMRVIHMR